MRNKTLRNALALGAITLAVPGCGYRANDLIQVEPNHAVVVIPLDGDPTKQKNFDAEKFYKDNLIQAGRVELPYRKRKIGFFPWQIEFVPTVRVVSLDRTTVSREWTSGSSDGTSSANQSLRAQTQDGISFSVDAGCAAQIESDQVDMARFLSRYGSRTLSAIMDNEMRTRIETKFVEICAKYDNDSLVKEKELVMNQVRKEVSAYFSARGITITALGLKGWFTYTPSVQESFDRRASAKQLLVAQRDTNARIRSEADANSYAAAKLTSGHGLDYQLRIKSLEIQKLNAENQSAAIAAWKGGAQVPQAVGTNSIFSMALNNQGK